MVVCVLACTILKGMPNQLTLGSRRGPTFSGPFIVPTAAKTASNMLRHVTTCPQDRLNTRQEDHLHTATVTSHKIILAGTVYSSRFALSSVSPEARAFWEALGLNFGGLRRHLGSQKRSKHASKLKAIFRSDFGMVLAKRQTG